MLVHYNAGAAKEKEAHSTGRDMYGCVWLFFYRWPRMRCDLCVLFHTHMHETCFLELGGWKIDEESWRACLEKP